MPIINIQILEGRSEEEVKALISSITNTVADELDISKEQIRVIITEVPKTHWGRGGVPLSDIPFVLGGF